MKSKITLCLLAGIFATALQAQNLPLSMQLSPDGHQLTTGVFPLSELYDSAIIRTIYLNFPQTNYWTLLTNGYQSKTDILASMTVDGIIYDSIGVRFKGQTSYQMVQNQKKSFNISMQTFVPDQTLMGYKTLNLNNAFQDPSFLREVFYQKQIRRHIPAAQSNFVHLYINNQDWGLYANVQQLNKDYLSEWFLSNDGANWRADVPDGSTGGPGGPGGPGGGWGDGTAALNYLGADTTQYQKYYTLKSSDQENPWSFLISTCDALNNTPVANLPDVLPDYLDIDRTLWHLASEIAFTDDDSYVYKGKMDYYLYYEPETGRITPLEYDGNSAMETSFVSWSPFYNANKVNYPLLYKILQVPQWRQRYLAHLRTLINERMDPTACNTMLTNYQNQINALVQSDPKKIYTYANFTSEVSALKNFISNRRNYLFSNAEVNQPSPTIASAIFYNENGMAWQAPVSGEGVWVKAPVNFVSGVNGVNLYYAFGLVGNFTATAMYDDGQHHDDAAADGIYGGYIPSFAAGAWVRYYVEAIANNPQMSRSYLPAGAEHDVFIYKVNPVVLSGPLVINEIMASNTNTAMDETGDYEDWIELYNNSNAAIDLSGYYLSDNPDNLPKYEIPSGVSIPANGYLVFWADEDGVDGPLHANFKLSASGEFVFLLDPNLNLLDSLSFGQQVSDKGLARVPNGSGPFVIQAPTFNANNNTVSSQEISESGGIDLSPNPVSDVVNIRISHLQKDQMLEIYDLTGRKLYACAQAQALNTLTVSNWPSGVYLVKYGNQIVKMVK